MAARKFRRQLHRAWDNIGRCADLNLYPGGNNIDYTAAAWLGA